MKLASASLAAGVVTALYTVPAGKQAIVTVALCNRGAASAKIRVALTNGAAPTDADWIEYDTPLPAAGGSGGSVLERTGLSLGAGQQIHVHATTAAVSATVHGLEQAVA
ncbi:MULTISPECIES: hypothetical protein [Brevundimonas]|jgi:hypothetical protein|uniref:hypothetical protein n=1 Tax=Brevundimonas sp. TaxID=1871086 RepID=UPI0025C572E9|nr:hypothetical protein [Brevundimonas sp.]MCG2663356.1 hypothetical protein [Brevundimonas sp.]